MSWLTKQLEDVADFTLGKMLDQKKNRGEPLPYLANVNVRWGEFDLDDLRYMKFESHEVERYSLKYGDIVMCEGGEPGRCAIWKKHQPGMMIQKALHRIRPHDCLDANYLFYFFLHTEKMGGFAPFFTGATIKHLPREKLAKINITIPPRPIQERISSILSGYDDLIAINQNRIALLEESVRLLYQEWFINLRFPNHQTVKNCGDLPQGWSTVSLGDLVFLNYGKALKNSSRHHGVIPVYGSSGVVGWHDQALVSGPGIIVGRKGNVGSVYFSECDFFPIDTVFYVTTEQSSYFVHQLLKTMNFISSDSAVPGLNRNYAHGLQVLKPEERVLAQFEQLVDPIYRQIEILLKANKNTAEARDALLPKLMSGAIRV